MKWRWILYEMGDEFNVNQAIMPALKYMHNVQYSTATWS